jgi:phenylacetate-CoA ligase
MDLHTPLAQNVIIPWYERRWGLETGGLLRSLQQSQYDTPERIHQRQWDALRKLLEFVSTSNPFYRERFRSAGFRPSELRGPDDLAAIPVLSKDDIRSRGADLISDGYSPEGMFHKRTGGSTGVPVHLYWDRDAYRFKGAVVKRHDAWAGYRFGDKHATLWGDTEKRYPLRERIFHALCARTIFLDTLLMDEAHLRNFVQRLRRFRPPVLYGHAHSVYFFTRYLIDEGIDDIRFTALISTAETLLPAERQVIESRFGRVLFDRYGCEELSLIASECESHDGLHIAAEGLYVEVLGGDEQSPGRVVVTDLMNRGMPLVRYEVGDLATIAPGRCSCGRGLPRLGRVFGRTTDILYAPDGRKISGVSILDTFVIHVPGVHQAQIVQDALDHVILRIVRDSGFGPASVAHLGQTVSRVFGPAMRHHIEYVEAIAPTPRGKYQFTICQVSPPQSASS